MSAGSGQNGYLSLKNPVYSHAFPHIEAGEALDVADMVGLRADADTSRVLMFKAFAGATSGDNVQVAACAIAMKNMPVGDIDAYNRWSRLATPSPLPSLLSGLKPGDPVYLSDTVPGAITKTKPTASGHIVQVVGRAFWEGSRITGINASEDANGIALFIEPATVI